jgi:hypothetical protein
VGGVLTDHSGLHKNLDKLLIGFEAHVIHEPGIEVSAGNTAEIADALGQGEERSGCGLGLFDVVLVHGVGLSDQVAGGGDFAQGVVDAAGVSDVGPIDLVGSEAQVIVEVATDQRVQFAGTGEVVTEGLESLLLLGRAGGFGGCDWWFHRGHVIALNRKKTKGFLTFFGRFIFLEMKDLRETWHTYCRAAE